MGNRLCKMQSVLLTTCAGGNSVWLSFVKGEFRRKVSLQERIEGNHTHFSPLEVTAPVHLAIRVCLCLFIRKRILHGCGYEQADLLKSEIT